MSSAFTTQTSEVNPAKRQVGEPRLGEPRIGDPTSVQSQELVAGSLGFATSVGSGQRGRRFLLFFDLVLVWLGAGLAQLLFFAVARITHGPTGHLSPSSPLSGVLFLFSVLVVLFANNHGLYQRIWQRRLVEEIRSMGEAIASASIVLAATIYLETVRVGSIAIAGMTIAFSWLLLAGWRRFLHFQAIPGLTEKRNALIVGGGRTAHALQAHLNRNIELGYVVKGLIDRRRRERPDGSISELDPLIFLGRVADLPRLIREHFIDEIFVCVPSDKALVMEVANYTLNSNVQLRVVPDLYDGMAMHSPVEYIGEFPTMTLHRASIPTLGLIFKRFVDIMASFLLLVLSSPVLLIIGLLVRLDSEGPALYSSFRVGRKGETFRCYKFRTMVTNADAAKDALRHLNEREGVTFKISHDPRVTRFGRIIRKYSLDELPQLWNVLLGHLSLVGPRPHPLDDYSRYALEHRRRLEVKPGITGLWQVTARRDPSFEKNVELDLEYIQNWSLWLDFQILWKTVAVVIAGTGQ